jgi:glycosyltransferase involved in cell wall biosynthesis
MNPSDEKATKMSTQTRHIAIVSDAVHPYHKGGKETRILELSTRLAKQGHDVHIYTMRWWKGESHRVENGVHLHAISRLYPLYTGERRSIKQGILFALACLKLIREDFDIAEVDHMPFFPLYTVKIVCILKRKPMFATWHEVWGRKYWNEYLGKLGSIAYLIERFSVYLPDRIIAVSPLTARRLAQDLHYRGPLTLATNGIDVAKIGSVRPSTEASDIIFVGRLLAHKNVDLLIHAVAELRATRPNIRCLIIGGGPEAGRLQRLITKLGLDQNIRLTGVVERDRDIHAFMKASRVFVLPSAREGFGITILEANAAGLPAVTVDLPDNAARLLIGRHNGYIAPATVAGLTQHIGRLLDGDDSAMEPVTAASNYSWDAAASTIDQTLAVAS